MEKAKIYFLQGLPASGKSTWSENKILEDFSSGVITKRVNKDLLRDMLDAGRHSSDNEAFILTVRNNIIKGALSMNYNIIIDDCNLNPYHYKSIKKIADMFGAKLEKLFFDAELETCIDRDSKRQRPVGGDAIINMYNKYIK